MTKIELVENDDIVILYDFLTTQYYMLLFLQIILLLFSTAVSTYVRVLLSYYY